MAVRCCIEASSEAPIQGSSWCFLWFPSAWKKHCPKKGKGKRFFCPHMSLLQHDPLFRCYFRPLSLHYMPTFLLARLFQQSFFPLQVTIALVFPSRSMRGGYKQKKRRRKKQHSALWYSDPALISFLKMTEEKDHIWRKSLYNGLGKKKKKMTIAHAITSPSGARTKSPKETPYKHSVCSRQLEMCSVSHLLYLWCISSRVLQ